MALTVFRFYEILSGVVTHRSGSNRSDVLELIPPNTSLNLVAILLQVGQALNANHHF